MKNKLLILSSGTLISRVLGLLRDIAIFNILGLSLETSAFILAYEIPIMSKRLLGESNIRNSFIPFFIKEKQSSLKNANEYLNIFFTKFCTFIGILTLIVISLMFLSRLYFSTEKQAMPLYLLSITVLFIWFSCSADLLNGVLNILNSYSLTSLSHVLVNSTLLLGLFLITLFTPTNKTSVIILSWFFVFSGFLQCFLAKSQLKRKNFILKICYDKNDAVSETFKMFLLNFFGFLIFQVIIYIERFLAYSVSKNGISYLHMSRVFSGLPTALVLYSIITVFFTKLSISVNIMNKKISYILCKNSIHLLLLIIIPAAIGLYFFSEKILLACFFTKKISYFDIQQTSILLKLMAIDLPFSAITILLSQIFYANKNVKIPIKITINMIIVYIINLIIFVPFFKLNALIIAFIVADLVQFLIQIVILRKNYPYLNINMKTFLEIPWHGILLFGIFVYIIHLTPDCFRLYHISISLLIKVMLCIFTYLMILFAFDKKSFSRVIKFRLLSQKDDLILQKINVKN